MTLIPDRYCERLTYAGLRGPFAWAAATLAAAVPLCGCLGAGGILATVLAGVLYAPALLVSRWLASEEKYDSALADLVSRARAFVIAGACGGSLAALGCALLVRGPIFPWVILWLPLCVIQGVVLAGLTRAGFPRGLAGLSLAIAGIGTMATTAWTWPALAAFLCAVCGLQITDVLARHSQSTLLRGRANLRDVAYLMARTALPAAAAVLVLGPLAGSPPSGRADWARGAVRGLPFLPPMDVGAGEEPGGGSGGTGEGGAESAAPTASSAQTPAAATRAAMRLASAARELRTMFLRNLPRIIAGTLTALGAMIAWALYRIWKARRSAPQEKPAQIDAPDAARRHASRKAPAAPPADARGAVVHYYNRFRREIGPHGYKPMPAFTPIEYARFLSVRVPQGKDAIDEITLLFEDAGYTPDGFAVPPDAGRRAETCYKRILACVSS